MTNALFSAPSLLRRMAAWLYEGMLVFGVLFTASYFFSVLTQTRHGLHNRGWQQGVLFIVLGLYFVWSWKRGQTLAMKTWRLALCSRSTLGPITWSQALGRYLLSWLWFAPPLLLSALLPQGHYGMFAFITFLWWLAYALLSFALPARQFLHDHLCGTLLLDRAA